MSNIEIVNIYYRQKKDIPEYMDVFFETNIGILKYNITSLDFRDCNELNNMNRIEEIDGLKKTYGRLYIDEVRITYDNNMYLLISKKIILAIEYVMNSNFKNSVQELRIIKDINDSNKKEFEDFKELDIVKLPSLAI